MLNWLKKFRNNHRLIYIFVTNLAGYFCFELFLMWIGVIDNSASLIKTLLFACCMAFFLTLGYSLVLDKDLITKNKSNKNES